MPPRDARSARHRTLLKIFRCCESNHEPLLTSLPHPHAAIRTLDAVVRVPCLLLRLLPAWCLSYGSKPMPRGLKPETVNHNELPRTTRQSDTHEDTQKYTRETRTRSKHWNIYKNANDRATTKSNFRSKFLTFCMREYCPPLPGVWRDAPPIQGGGPSPTTSDARPYRGRALPPLP